MASFLGIDISKETFHASLLSDRGEAKKVFPNTPKGFEQLVAWLKNRHADDVHACMEATGAYWEALALYLHGLKLRVSVINPARIKALAQSDLLRTKTDAIDAALIARFCKSQNPEAWIPRTSKNARRSPASRPARQNVLIAQSVCPGYFRAMLTVTPAGWSGPRSKCVGAPAFG